MSDKNRPSAKSHRNGARNKKDRKRALAMDSRCVNCGAELDDSTATLEHLIPLSTGGSHDWSNLAVACESCNSGRADRPPSDGLQREFEKRKVVIKTKMITGSWKVRKARGDRANEASRRWLAQYARLLRKVYGSGKIPMPGLDVLWK